MDVIKMIYCCLYGSEVLECLEFFLCPSVVYSYITIYYYVHRQEYIYTVRTVYWLHLKLVPLYGFRLKRMNMFYKIHICTIIIYDKL